MVSTLSLDAPVVYNSCHKCFGGGDMWTLAEIPPTSMVGVQIEVSLPQDAVFVEQLCVVSPTSVGSLQCSRGLLQRLFWAGAAW